MKNTIEDIIRRLGVIFTAIIILVTPFTITIIKVFERPTISQMFFLQTALLVMGLIYFPLAILFRRDGARISRLTIYILFYCLIVFASSVQASSVLFSLREGLFLLIMVSFFFLVKSFNLSLREKQRLVQIYLLTAIPVALYGLLQAFGFELLKYDPTRMVGKYQILSFLGNPNYIGSYLAPLAFLSFGMTFVTRSRMMRICYGLLGFIIFLCLFLAGTRGAWLGILFGFVVVFILMGRFRLYPRGITLKRIAAACIIVILLGSIGGVVILKKVPFNIRERLVSGAEIRHRLLLWQIGRDMALHQPILGIGYRQYDITFNDYLAKFFTYSPENRAYSYIIKEQNDTRPGHAHNEYIEILAETGTLGLMAFLLIVIGAIRYLLKAISRVSPDGGSKQFLIFMTGGFICMLLDAFWGFPFQLPCSGLLFWFMLGLIDNQEVPNNVVAAEKRKITPTRILCAIALIIVFIAAQGIVAKRIAGVYYKRNAAILSGEDIDRYQELLEKAVHYDPLYGHAWLPLSDVNAVKEEYVTARDQILKAENTANIGGAGYKKLGILYLQVRDVGYAPAARLAFEKALIILPDDPEILENLAIIEFEDKNYERAQQYIEMAMREEPLLPNSYYLLGAIYDQSEKNPVKAFDYYNRALKSSLYYDGRVNFNQEHVISRLKELEARVRERK
jgi:putative inorganic carbon (HCO3(-)) transporter